MKFPVIVLCAAIWTAPALAQCPAEQLQKAVDLNAQANALAKGADPSAIVAGLEANARLCALDPHVMIVDARSWIALATKTNDTARLSRFADGALSSLLASERQAGSANAGQRAAVANGKTIAIMAGSNLDIISSVVRVALETERITGGTLPSNPPPGSGAPAQQCDSNTTSHARSAMQFVQQVGDAPGAQNVLDRAMAACGADVWQGQHIRVYAAQMLQAMAERNPSAPGLLERMLAAARAIDGVSQSRNAPIGWDREAEGKFAKALFAAASAGGWTMPVDTWFTPENLNKSWTSVAMAVALDKAWAEGQATGGDIRVRTQPYRDLFVEAYTTAANGPEDTRGLAKDTLYWAARRHAEGTYRGKGNEALPPPQDFLWKSLHDPYK